MKYNKHFNIYFIECRSPHGERGLKSNILCLFLLCCRRSPHGERGLKFLRALLVAPGFGRSPHGERGLKCVQTHNLPERKKSLPAWGAWIEIVDNIIKLNIDEVAPRMGSVD